MKTMASVVFIGLLVSSGCAQADGYVQCLFSKSRNSMAFIKYEYTEKGGQSAPEYGSGFLVSADGYILTAAHVLSPPESVDAEDVVFEQVSVTLGTSVGGESETAAIIKRDRDLDVALLKIKEKASPRPFLKLGQSGNLAVGDELTGLGFPNGSDIAIVPTSSLTAKNAVISGVLKQFWQTGLAFNPGNSGGPVFDGKGLVVGIADRIAEEEQLISYVIPIQQASPMLSIAGVKVSETPGPCGRVEKGWAYYGNYSEILHKWNERNFDNDMSATRLPKIGDTITALTDVNIRSGPIDCSGETCVNQPKTGLIRKYEKLNVLNVAGPNGYPWVEFSFKN